MRYTIMQIPQGFKIRKKADIETFINTCMCGGCRYSVIDNDVQCFIEKDKDGNVSVDIRYGDFNNIWNPSLEVASTKNNCYKETVQDYIWKFRKAINAEYFTKRKVW